MMGNHRCAWVSGVMDDLSPHIDRADSVTYLSDKVYREFLKPKLWLRGLTARIPMQGLGIGLQLAWLSNQARP